VVSRAAPDRLIAAKQAPAAWSSAWAAARCSSPPDIPAILAHTRDVVILEDNDMAVVTAHGVELTTVEGDPVQREPVKILWDPIMAEKGGYRHFMLKEIYEQPRAITDTFRGRIAPGDGQRHPARREPRPVHGEGHPARRARSRAAPRGTPPPSPA